MFSNIFLSRSNLLFNLEKIKESAHGKLCIMIKANAYGHGAKEIVQILNDRVDCFGVSNQKEGEEVRSLTNAKIIVFGACEDYQECIKKNISFAVFSLEHAKKIIKIFKDLKIKPQMHLCINTGMNRYGVQSIKEYLKILNLLKKNNLILEGLYTHFSSLTSDKNYTEMQYNRFQEFVKLLTTKETIIHVGGGNSIFKSFNADMFRIGLGIYGYGIKDVKPVLSVESQIVDIQNVKQGQHVGYLCSYTAKKDMKIATIPLGYADGFPRKLSNKIKIKINDKEVKNVGNICMDAFMVDISNVKCKIGDKVVIMENIKEMAYLTETSEYEILTNLSKFRGERKIK